MMNKRLLGTLLILLGASIPLPAGSVGPCMLDDLEVVFFDVGQGDSTLIKCPNGSRILVDCGSTSNAAPGDVKTELLKHLDSANPKIDTLVVTHPDEDHYNLLKEVLVGVHVGRVLLPGSPEDNEGEEKLIDQYTKRGFDGWLREAPHRTKIRWMDEDNVRKNPSSLFSSGAVKFCILAANVGGDLGEKNTRSIVLKVTYKEFDLVLTGDATKETENSILARFPADDDESDWLDVDFLKLGHHGSRATSTQKKWVDRLKPEYGMASAGKDNSYGHPNKEAIQRAAAHFLDHDPHKIRWGTAKGEPIDLVNDYKKAFWTTAHSKNIRLRSDGRDQFATIDPDLN